MRRCAVLPVLDRLQAFLPRMAEANQKLQEQMEQAPAGHFDIECVDEAGRAIEMVGASRLFYPGAMSPPLHFTRSPAFVRMWRWWSSAGQRATWEGKRRPPPPRRSPTGMRSALVESRNSDYPAPRTGSKRPTFRWSPSGENRDALGPHREPTVPGGRTASSWQPSSSFGEAMS